MAADDGFRQLDKESLAEYIEATPCLSSKLGDKLDDMQIEMVEEGLMNFVYIVKCSGGSMIIKQALPFIRAVGIPMSRERSKFEVKALQVYSSVCPSHVPELYHYDPSLSLIAMQYLEPPHILLQKGLIEGIQYPLLAEHISDILANMSFQSSRLYKSTTEHRRAVADFYGNSEMTNLMEQLSYMAFGECQHSSWTSPELDLDVKALHEDNSIKLEVFRLYTKFSERAQALIHSDFHSGSIMVTQNSTQVIDPEYAFYGPIGYDIGTFFRNLMLPYFAQDGLATEQNDRQDYKMWLLKTLEDTWNLFQRKFIKLWNEHRDNGSDEAPHSKIYNNSELWERLQRNYMEEIFQDALGFCATYVIGSVIRVGAVEDFKSIANVSKRADCERKALNFGKMLLKETQTFSDISKIVSSLPTVLLIKL